MKFMKALLRNKFVFAGLLIVCLLIMGFSGVQTSRAALTFVSRNFTAEMTVSDIGITLVENDKDISWRNYEGDGTWSEAKGELLTDMGAVQFGRVYPEELCVRNTGSIDEYVRVIVTRYWGSVDDKSTELTPSLIDLHFTEGSGWVVDQKASTAERTVLYYTAPLGVGETTSLFADTIRIDGSVARKVTQRVKQEDGYKVISTVFDYHGERFVLEAEVDGVQTHSAEEAIKSAWGVDVSVSADGTLSVN